MLVTVMHSAQTLTAHTLANVDKGILEMEEHAAMSTNAHFKLKRVPLTPFAQTRSVHIHASVRMVSLELQLQPTDVLTLTSVFWVGTTALRMLPVWTLLDHFNAFADKGTQEMEGNVLTSMNA